MQLIPKTLIKSLILTAPIAFASTIAIAPSYAASIAGASGELILQDFSWAANPDSFEAITNTFTTAIAPAPGATAMADAVADASVKPEKVEQFSAALATGSGTDYFATGKGNSQTGIGFDPGCGCFQFNFKATLALLTVADPGEIAQAHSFVAFKVYKNDDPFTFVDYLKADLWSPTDFQLRLSDTNYINVSLLDQQDGFAQVEGTYRRKFDDGTGLTVRGFTNTEAVATVPAPPMFAVVILPVLTWLKRRAQMKTSPQEVSSRQAD
ncbi:MAG: hypothetical protein KME10_07770 [Plectolyngbya sp. WJT66-NPBG17]|jgi:hypothetical protein|nr:hypothetical protein [Plectolyngbya sp. WJT66-NPBG17]